MNTHFSGFLCAILSMTPALGFAQASPTSTRDDRSQLRSLALAGVSTKNKDVARAIDADTAQYEVSKEVADQDSEVVAKLRASIRERTGLPSSAGLQPLVSELQLLRETLQQEDAAAAGRRAGLEAAIAEWTTRAKAQAVDDPALKELELVVEKQEHTVARMKELVKTASISQAEFEDGVATLALDKAKIVTARTRAANTANEAADAWNRELMNLNIAAQERTARFKYIEGRLKTLEPVLDDLDRLDAATAELRAAEQDLRSARQRHEEDLRLFPSTSPK